MTETWLKEGDRDFLAEASPIDFLSLNSPRTGGEVGVSLLFLGVALNVSLLLR